MRRAAGLLLWASLTLVLIGVVAAGGGWLWLHRHMAAPGPLAEERVVYLPRGTGVTAIAERLREAGVIEHPLAFLVALRLSGRDRGLRAGEYRFAPGMSPEEVAALLESGRTVLHRVTVPEGLTVREVYALLEQASVLVGDLPPLPGEGELLPETYLVPRDEARARIVEQMRHGMREALDQAWANRAEDLPLASPEELLILASIIEKETSVEAEYPLVAGVFVNRLRRGMRLQTDPTVIYGLTEGSGPLGRALTRADLQTEHAFNTYLIDGLPPGPIANPGRRAIEAAARPARTDYLYFVADGSGGHAFARTLEEHNRNVRRWRELQRGG
jgi:UPF0755 protein